MHTCLLLRSSRVDNSTAPCLINRSANKLVISSVCLAMGVASVGIVSFLPETKGKSLSGGGDSPRSSEITTDVVNAEAAPSDDGSDVERR
jgi:hypothetical protein